MNWKRGFKRLTWILSVIVGLLCCVWPCWVYYHDTFIVAEGKFRSEHIGSLVLPCLLCFAIGWSIVWAVYGIVHWVVKGFCGTNGHIWMQMGYKEIQQAERKKKEILNMQDEPAGSREAKLKELAKELSLSTISRRGAFNADETELVDNINNALQTARVINSAAINSIIAIIAAIAAWAAVLAMVLVAILGG